MLPSLNSPNTQQIEGGRPPWWRIAYSAPRMRPDHIAKETPGFVVNRIQLALLREVWSLLDEGVASAQDIDAAVKGTLGLRMASTGPLRVDISCGVLI